jgi:hypothetical protein
MALVYPVLILVIMTWFFLSSPSVSLVHSGFLFICFILLLLFFHLRFCGSIALVVSYLAKICGGYVSVGCITSSSAVFASMSAFSFPVMPLWPGTHTKDTFSPSSSNFFLGVFGFFCCSFLPWTSMCLTCHLRLPFLFDFLVVPMTFILASCSRLYTVKTGVSFRHLLRHRNSASTSVFSTLKSVCLRVKTTLLSVKTTQL